MKRFKKLSKLTILLCVLLLSQDFAYRVMAAGIGEDVSSEETVSGNGIQNNDETNNDEADNEAEQALQAIVDEHPIIALVYLSDQYPIRKDAVYESDAVVTVPSGQQVQIQDALRDNNGEVWIYVTLLYRNVMYEGYIPRSHLACSDERFLTWEAEYGMNTVAPQNFRARTFAAPLAYADVNQFPASYRAALTALKQAHPDWIFVPMNTNLDWNYVVTEEMKGGRSLVPTSFEAPMRLGKYDNSWSYASQDALKYYLDPRNGLTEELIFQFELLTYNANYHTKAAVQSFLKNTFMSGTVPETSKTYADVFWEVGSGLQVSPFHLASRVYQEQGQGTSPLISGTYPGYVGYYNFFNVGASGTSDTEVITRGLQKAKDEGWNTREASIKGGAKFISQNYILKGQDTLYLQKFDVDENGTKFTHQYMQNIVAPFSEGQNIRKLYINANSLDNTFVFKIPVYNNMPASACPKPTVSYSVTLTPPSSFQDARIYLDGVEYNATKSGINYVTAAPNGNAKTAVMYEYSNGVPVGMYAWSLQHNGNQYVATAIPGLEDLLTYHGFSVRITGKSGIRVKTGISTDVRARLLSSGISGYTLKEYGTLVMNNANRTQYPMIYGGQKVLSGMSYGRDAKGALVNTVYENVSGRYRFTSVLVGLPTDQYKVDYAFRGYIILTKSGQDIILYGPVVYKSIYSISEQLLSSGQYPPGSEANTFLNQIVTDAK